MKLIIALFVCTLLGGCWSYQPDQRVVGRFHATSGEILEIRPDGRIVYEKEEKKVLVGLVTISKEAPLSIRVIAPDTSPLIGTKIVFSADRKEAEVEWQSAVPSDAKPTSFRKE